MQVKWSIIILLCAGLSSGFAAGGSVELRYQESDSSFVFSHDAAAPSTSGKAHTYFQVFVCHAGSSFITDTGYCISMFLRYPHDHGQGSSATVSGVLEIVDAFGPSRRGVITGAAATIDSTAAGILVTAECEVILIDRSQHPRPPRAVMLYLKEIELSGNNDIELYRHFDDRFFGYLTELAPWRSDLEEGK